jgi:hypothetical protein
VLKPGGKAFLTDDHRAPGQVENVNSYSPSDGTEVVEVLDELKKAGVTATIIEERLAPNRSMKRVIVLQKPVAESKH